MRRPLVPAIAKAGRAASRQKAGEQVFQLCFVGAAEHGLSPRELPGVFLEVLNRESMPRTRLRMTHSREISFREVGMKPLLALELLRMIDVLVLELLREDEISIELVGCDLGPSLTELICEQLHIDLALIFHHRDLVAARPLLSRLDPHHKRMHVWRMLSIRRSLSLLIQSRVLLMTLGSDRPATADISRSHM